MIDIYLNIIQESKVFSKNANAPCAAYETVYGEKCPHRRGQYPGKHYTKTWQGILVDGNLKRKWLSDLANIKQIEMRSSCEGHEENWVSFIIFRLNNPKLESNKRYLTRLILNLEKSDKITKASWSIGRGEGRPRIVVAAPIWVGQPDWEQWWSTLALRVKRSL